jgi:hypothetical protein
VQTHRSIGMDSDQLIGRLAGEARDRRDGDRIGRAHKALYASWFDGVDGFDGATGCCARWPRRAGVSFWRPRRTECRASFCCSGLLRAHLQQTVTVVVHDEPADGCVPSTAVPAAADRPGTGAGRPVARTAESRDPPLGGDLLLSVMK